MSNNTMAGYIFRSVLALMLLCISSGCFTGVESTPKITDKDVSRTIGELERRQPTMTLQPYCDSLQAWKPGKRFFVSDSQVKLIFESRSGNDLDSVKFEGSFLDYLGYELATGVDNREVVTLLFKHSGDTLMYHTGRTLAEFPSSYSIPLLVDMDLVSSVSSQLKGKSVYIKTPIWYDPESEAMIHGRQFIKVNIDDILPGNKVLPVKVCFTAGDNGQKAFVWMSTGQNAINNRDYDTMFSAKDMHENYPEITAAHWNLIIHGEVTLDMTKEECRLAKGAPKSISRLPNQSDVREIWYYDGGSYLQFVDGLLKNFRK